MDNQQNKVKLFREKSLEAIESPEKLNDYLHVTSPGVWLVLLAVIALLAGFVLWGIFGSIKTTARLAVSSENGRAVAYVPFEAALQGFENDGAITLDNGEIYYIKSDAESDFVTITEDTSIRIRLAGEFSVGDIVLELELEGAPNDGVYSASAVTEDIKPISLLLN